MENKRLSYLDTARGLAILLVVLGHIWEDDRPVPILIYSFHVPLFFIISGILAAYTRQEKRPVRQLVLSGLQRLIIPYFFFEAVFAAVFGIRSHFDFSSQNARIFDSLLLSPMNVPLWFLPTLFLSELFFVLLLRTVRSRKCAALLCLALYLFPFIPEIGHILPDALLRCLLSLGFLAAGYFGADLILAKNPPLRLLLPAAAADCLLALRNGKTGIYKLVFHNPVLFTVCALTGSCCVIFLLKKFTGAAENIPCSLLAAAGRNSMVILGLHIIVLRILQEILGLRTDSLPGGLLALAGICILLAPVCAFMNRFLPFLIGKRR